jgi:anti-anti-sigma factor
MMDQQRGNNVVPISEEKSNHGGEPPHEVQRPRLSLESVRSGDRCLLSVQGELRHGNAQRLTEEAMRAFSSGLKSLVLDFRDVEYCDTEGFRTLVEIHKHVERDPELSLVVFLPKGNLLDVLNTYRFHKFLKITQDESVLAGDWKPC